MTAVNYAKGITVGRSSRVRDGGTVEIKVEIKDGELHMCGAVWNAAGTDWISGGQNYDSIKSDCATLLIPEAQLDRMLEIWQRWHLNHMRAGCAHQRATWDVSEPLQLTYYTWGERYHTARKRAEAGEMSPDEYTTYGLMHKRVYAATIGLNVPKYETAEIAELLTTGWLKVDKTETKTAGWVSPAEHPKGLLSKPCTECGYRYGSAWLKEELPPEILAEIRAW